MTSNYGYPVFSSRFPAPDSLYPFFHLPVPSCPVLSSLSLLAFPFAARPVAHDRLSDQRNRKKKRLSLSLFLSKHISFVLAVVAEACSSTYGLPLAASLLSHSEMRKRLSLIVYRSRLSLASHLARCLAVSLTPLRRAFNIYSTIS